MSQDQIDEPTPKKSGFLNLANARDVVIILALIVLSWKLLTSNFGFTIETLSLTDIIFLLLALFSIGLSVAFYFKASDTSNQFYQQTHTFTKETSELLGRVESGLVERLGSLDKNYTTMTAGMLSSFSRTGYPSNGDEEARERTVTAQEVVIEQKESEISEREKALQTALDDLINKANLNDQEKAQTRKLLDDKENDLKNLRRELQKAENTLERYATNFEEIKSEKTAIVIRYLVNLIRKHSERVGSREKINLIQAKIGFRDSLEYIAPAAFRDLHALGLMEEQNLSREAALRIVEAWNS